MLDFPLPLKVIIQQVTKKREITFQENIAPFNKDSMPMRSPNMKRSL